MNTPAMPGDASLLNEPHREMPAKIARKETLFHLVAASAKNVLLAADFTGWNQAPIKMVRGSAGIWNVKVALAPGRYRYRFLIDFDSASKPSQGAVPHFPFGSLQGMVEVVL